jgi:restriction system protein
MKQAGLFAPRGRGSLTITPRGLEVLAEDPERLSVSALKRFPEFLDFQSRTRGKRAVQPDERESVTLEESLEATWVELRERLAQELLERVRAASPGFFERLVVDLLVAMGYGGSHADAAQVVGGSGDGGVDGVIKQDRLGLDVVYVQAKRWAANVGRPEVQAFAGGLDGRQATKGVLITTSAFSQDALAFVDRISKRIVLIDGQQLARHMIEYRVGAATARTYYVQRVDLDYFEDS